MIVSISRAHPMQLNRNSIRWSKLNNSPRHCIVLVFMYWWNAGNLCVNPCSFLLGILLIAVSLCRLSFWDHVIYMCLVLPIPPWPACVAPLFWPAWRPTWREKKTILWVGDKMLMTHLISKLSIQSISSCDHMKKKFPSIIVAVLPVLNIIVNACNKWISVTCASLIFLMSSSLKSLLFSVDIFGPIAGPVYSGCNWVWKGMSHSNMCAFTLIRYTNTDIACTLSVSLHFLSLEHDLALMQ